MTLIEEIEAATVCDEDGTPKDDRAYLLVNSSWWPRLRAALEAGEKMRECLEIYGKLAGGQVTKADLALRKWRETNGS